MNRTVKLNVMQYNVLWITGKELETSENETFLLIYFCLSFKCSNGKLSSIIIRLKKET